MPGRLRRRPGGPGQHGELRAPLHLRGHGAAGVPPPRRGPAADGSVTEPSTAALHWRLAGLGDPPAELGAGAAQPTESRVGREPSPPEATEQREAGEPQPAEGAGAAAPEAPTEPAPQDAEAAHEAPGDEGPAPEDKPRPRAGEGR